VGDQSRLYDLGRESDEARRLPVVRVERVERIGRRARAVLRDPSGTLEGYPPAVKSVVYFEYVDGDWTHSSPFASAIFWAFLDERRPAGTVTPPLIRTPTPPMD
jgi:hypothetical protein